ncbi:MAG: EamA family transporter [Planctomycetota bacterium]|nr:EamA family transporter [Planctomycetota bacterium]
MSPSPVNPWRFRLLVLAAAVLWSLSGVVLKAPAFEDLPADGRGPAIAGLRALFAALALLPMVRPRRIRWRLGLIPMAACFASMSVLFISALMTTTAAATIFLQYTSVVWACLLGWLLLRERPGRPDAIAVLCVVAGIGVILANETGSPLGNGLALASGVAYAGVVVSLRALRNEDPIWLSFLNQIVSAAVILPWFLIKPIDLTATQIGWIAFLGAFQLALPYVLFSTGVRHVSAREASILLLVEPVLNPLWVLLVWGEQAAWATWIGGGIILGGLVLRFAVAGARRPPLARDVQSVPESAPIAASASAPQ